MVPADPRRGNDRPEGLNLLALKEKRSGSGSAILETTGDCHPCSRMEEILGTGGYNAMRGLRRWQRARVVEGGTVNVGGCLFSPSPRPMADTTHPAPCRRAMRSLLNVAVGRSKDMGTCRGLRRSSRGTPPAPAYRRPLRAADVPAARSEVAPRSKATVRTRDDDTKAQPPNGGWAFLATVLQSPQ